MRPLPTRGGSLSSRATASSISVVLDDERRQQAHDILAGRNDEHVLGARGDGEIRVGHVELQAQQQALAAHFGDDVGITGPSGPRASA